MLGVMGRCYSIAQRNDSGEQPTRLGINHKDTKAQWHEGTRMGRSFVASCLARWRSHIICDPWFSRGYCWRTRLLALQTVECAACSSDGGDRTSGTGWQYA